MVIFLLFLACCLPITLGLSFNANITTTSGIILGVTVLPSGLTGISYFSFPGGGAQVISQAPSLSATFGNSSGRVGATMLGLGGGQASVTPLCLAGCAASLAADGASITVSGLSFFLPGAPSSATFATETWTLSLLNASAVSWVVQRTYAQGGALAVSRLALALKELGDTQPIHGPQVPSFRDASMFLNESSTGGFATGLDASEGGLFEYLSPTTNQAVRFSPSAAIFRFAGASTSSPALFSHANVFGDGTTEFVSLGFEMCDPRAPPRSVKVGDVETLTLVLHQIASDFDPLAPLEEDPFPRIAFSHPNASLVLQVGTLAAVQFQHKGWLFGNNPGSSPCLHEMAWFPLIHGLFDADSVALLAKELSFFARSGWQPQDYNNTVFQHAYFDHTSDLGAGAQWGLSQRYSSAGFYQCPWGPLQDENPMFFIAVYYTYLASGDLPWLASMRPALDAMRTYFEKRGLVLGSSGQPVVYRSPSSGLPDKGRHASNWYDIIEFGCYDAFIAVHAVWGLDCLSKLYEALGDAPASAAVGAIHQAAVVDFNTMFWSEDSSTYYDWVDSAGAPRKYFYVDIAFTAIIAKVANASQASALLQHYDTRLADIESSLGVQPDNIWSPPGNLYSVVNGDCLDNGERDCTVFPSYENGGSFFHSAGLQVAALGAVGRADDAVSVFSSFINSGFGNVRGWAQQLYWGTHGASDTLVLGDPLNTALLSVWGLLQAGFGVEPTLGGLRSRSKPAASFEGAGYNMTYMGAPVCLYVQGGETRFCSSGAAVPPI